MEALNEYDQEILDAIIVVIRRLLRLSEDVRNGRHRVGSRHRGRTLERCWQLVEAIHLLMEILNRPP